MTHPQEPPPYRYGPEQPSGSPPPAERFRSESDEPDSPGSGTTGSPGSGQGPYVSGPHPTGATYQPENQQPENQQADTQQPGGEPHPQIPQQAGGPPAYGSPPGPPGGYPYGSLAAPTHPLAIASLVLGILTPLGFIPGVLAIIFGIVALVQIQERWQKGRGLAIGGLAATGGWVVVTLVAVLIGVTVNEGSGPDQAGTDRDRPPVTDGGSGGDSDRTPADRVDAGRRTPVDRLRDGMCVKELPFGEDQVRTIRVVDCEVPHVGEVYAAFELADRDWPGDEVVEAEARDGCHERLRQDLPHAWVDPAVEVYYLFPSGVSWGFGDRRVVCITQYMDGTRTGSLFDLDDSLSDADDRTSGDRTSVYDLEVGHCIQSLPAGQEEHSTFLTVDCDLPHEAEVYATFDLADRDWPGEDAVFEEADDACYGRLQQDHPDAWADPDVQLFYLYPTEVTWSFGDREVVCVAQYLDGTRTGSLFD